MQGGSKTRHTHHHRTCFAQFCLWSWAAGLSTPGRGETYCHSPANSRGRVVGVSLTPQSPVGVSAAPLAPYSAPRGPRPRREEGLGGGWQKGPVRTCAKTVRLPSGAVTFTRPWCHATPAPVSATPATAAAKGPGPGTPLRPAAHPRRSLAPQAASRTPRAAAIFTEAPHPGPRPSTRELSCPSGLARSCGFRPTPPSLRPASAVSDLGATGGDQGTAFRCGGNGGAGKGPGRSNRSQSQARQSPVVEEVPRVP